MGSSTLIQSNSRYIDKVSIPGLANVIILLLYFSINVTTSSATRTLSHSHSQEDQTEYIKTSCGITMYTDLCVETLSPYAKSIRSRPNSLANAALNVSLKGAQSTLNSVSKLLKGKHLTPKETSAISDCVENIKDSVSELRESLVAMKDLEDDDFVEKMGNVMTWVSAALTNEDTCMDGFEGNELNGEIKNTIRVYIVKVAHLTSNALALVKVISST